MSKFSHFCTNCGSTLENQEGYSSRKKSWICKECGQALYANEDKKRKFQSIVWICDGCGDILDNQKGFNDKKGTWKCKSCGFDNIIDESNIIVDKKEKSKTKKKRKSSKKKSKDSIKEDNNIFNNDFSNESDFNINDNENDFDDYNVDVEYDDDDDDDDYDYIDDDQTSIEEYEKIYEEKIKKKKMLEKIRREEENIRSEELKIDRAKTITWLVRNKKRILYTILIIIAFISVISLYLLYSSLITVGYDSEELVGLKYDIVEEQLLSKGFTDIETKRISDLSLKNRKKSDLVTEVIIGNKNKFKSKSKFLPNKKVVIVYHTTIKYYPPITSKEAKGKQYKDIVNQFEKAGFTNIETQKQEDLVTGWITKDGEVESITINSEENFDTFDEYEEDDLVVIKYHTFKGKNK